MGLGGAFGMGNVYMNNKDGTGTETLVGTSQLMQVSVGLQFGGQVFSEIIFFESVLDYERFTSGTFEFGADANVVALTASASISASTMGNQAPTYGKKPTEQLTVGNVTETYTKGSAVFTVALTGLMYEATVKGQKFSYKPITEAVLTE
jgi:lipid-binding SYLF domain-containing protein